MVFLEWDEFKDLLDSVPRMWKRSWDSHEEEIEWWYTAIKLWIEIETIIITSDMSGGYKQVKHFLERSFFFERLYTLQRASAWSLVAVLSGAYESSLRDLRFTIEDIVQAIYIDQVMGETKTTDKAKAIGFLEDVELRGSGLVSRADIPNDLRKPIISVYRRLSGFVHPSSEISSEKDTEHIYDFVYSKKMFKDTIELHKEAYDIVMALVVSKFPTVKQDLLLKKETLDFLGYQRTLGKLT